MINIIDNIFRDVFVEGIFDLLSPSTGVKVI